jgi:ABC-2 type transport system ATP-binding protein
MQQRLSVARVLLHDPKVLLMDEPASGLDPRARVEMRELLKELKRMGKTIIISSHILPELAEMCNTVGIIERGQLLFSGGVADAVKRAKMGQVVQVAVTGRHQQAAELLSKLPGVTKVQINEGQGPQMGGVTLPLIQVNFDGMAPGSSAAAGLNGGANVGANGAARQDLSDIPNILINNGFRLAQFTEEAVNLETAFMRLTKGLVQ